MSTTLTPPAGTDAAYLANVDKRLGKHLPVIIDAPGMYIARNGVSVEIFAINPPETATCNCKGTIYHPKKSGKGFRHEFNIWQPNGRKVFLDETDLDIVAKATS